MPEPAQSTAARFHAQVEEGLATLQFSGDWRVTAETLPRWETPVGAKACRLDFGGLGNWDSSLVLLLAQARAWAETAKMDWPSQQMPAELSRLLEQVTALKPAAKAPAPAENLFSSLGNETLRIGARLHELNHFLGDCLYSTARVIRQPHRFRWKDVIGEMQACGVMALPIVSLVSFLVGVTLAYTAAIILRLFGGDIWVADLIGLSMTREMSAVMTGVVLAGRTGAAFAAHIGNMKANEEIDALETLGVSPMDFLVLPRLLALALMTPLLALYANLMGILGGMVIALFLLSIPPTAYTVELLSIVDMSDITTGLLKASAFGIIVGMSGCLRGLQAERSAEGVGKAATSAVVTAILLMVVADAGFAVLFNLLGW